MIVHATQIEDGVTEAPKASLINEDEWTSFSPADVAVPSPARPGGARARFLIGAQSS